MTTRCLDEGECVRVCQRERLQNDITVLVRERDALEQDVSHYRQRAEKAEGLLSKIAEWARTFGSELKPRGADTYGEGVRDSKERVANILATLSSSEETP